jgi:hypothetical protein
MDFPLAPLQGSIAYPLSKRKGKTCRGKSSVENAQPGRETFSTISVHGMWINARRAPRCPYHRNDSSSFEPRQRPRIAPYILQLKLRQGAKGAN